jgi:hypothetical protein
MRVPLIIQAEPGDAAQIVGSTIIKGRRAMWRRLSSISTVSVLATVVVSGTARAQEKLPDLNGSYRCEPDPGSCKDSGQIFTVSQSGAKLNVRNDKGAVGEGNLTSNISLGLGPPWNTLGIILSDNQTIEWSAGTKWRKQ